ncbi:hypothetical protein M2459_001344 [Parabacteroides sp. PF5-5]|uniref:hypothetical protein n=1 Tax=unclassified Parabacteroides TaxID=2649774 RepID=UPI002474DB70|nr:MULTISPECIES: hypothetical protein [unclassified Parabacteroides]MDH6304609.1 hypothetical protein [Parabacteroides sp. PH5-39]MDH6315778.1 hypothetical protein [Parabacteroides sp. PF5-13]MDH6319437.1 hypothetical protein [Parabacteroides sp. PH5-13]MDH6323168.1 hypothetical protein [Parabacteroides sp. PH5-8]MDH6326970.1 hypothetical protein [Parabacteroides sp. PH5-41]
MKTADILEKRIPNHIKQKVFPPKVKIALINFGYRKRESEELDTRELDVTDLVETGEGFEVSFDRDGLSGIEVETGMISGGFVLEAKDFLKELYETYRQNAYCQLRIYLRDKVKVNQYTLIRTFSLDFSTIKIDDNRVTIEAENSDLNSYIKSAGKTKYDIPVSEIAESKKWQYNRMNLRQSVKWVPVAMEENVTGWVGAEWFYPYIYLSGSNVLENVKHEFRTQDKSSSEVGGLNKEGEKILLHFFKADNHVTVNLSFITRFTINRKGYDPAKLLLCKNGETVIKEWPFYVHTVEDIQDVTVDCNEEIELNESDTLSLVVSYHHNTSNPYQLTIDSFQDMELTFWAKGISRTIDVIDPEALLNKLVALMTNGRDFSGRIEWLNDSISQSESKLIAAESIRQLDNATMHISFDDFKDWMGVKGYEREYQDNEVVFKPRGQMYKSDVVLELSESEVSDLIIEADQDHLYTSVEIGYKEQNYDDDGLNSRYETNGTFSYDTGYITQKDNVLSLISPFRADPIGIDLLCWKTPEESKESASNKSDNDIFELVVYKSDALPGNNYYTYDAVYLMSGGIKLFNATLNPFFLALANMTRFGIVTNKLYFKGTTNYREATLQGYTSDLIYVDVPIFGKLFEPFVYNFATSGRIVLPVGDDINGLVKFRYKKKNYQGYLKSGVQNVLFNSEKQLILYAKE